ncbi:hypothetical protein FIBSPDRAFT_947070 [Athelia psychrophila]|uniref:L-tryptophan decarboxylase PsiD-like domain-containing protein n=1 Tax=Athelia psychrophila TaxID=1759441 RepID=A0A166S6F7_9AGAM|nr:hypothetical protein FIBSPDRAFT_947070 [Fibularhizoctonia sp. CBS 109695]
MSSGKLALPHQTSYHKYGGCPPTILHDGPTQHIPAVEEFKNAIEGGAATKDIFDHIFQQVPNFETLLSLLDCILPKGPSFHIDTDAEGNVVGKPIGIPIYLIFNPVQSNAAAAYDLFRLPHCNAAPKNLLGSQGNFLRDERF